MRCRLLFELLAILGWVALLSPLGAEIQETSETPEISDVQDINAMHEQCFIEDCYPSAEVCRTCHPDHYREWSVSQHAYAMMSPVFTSMYGTLLKKTNGTIGDFCIRCHSPIGMNVGEPLFAPVAERAQVVREGVTCVVCHRVSAAYGKVNGRLALCEGDITEPIKGPTGNKELMRVLSEKDTYKVVTDPDSPGRKIHSDVIEFFALTTPGFCGMCHDVTSPTNLRLEEAFSEFKTAPAARECLSCQDCHMGKVPGEACGFAEGPAAIVGREPTRPRKRTNHYFAGPDHSVVHPGIFPHNPEAAALATIEEWTCFDYCAGWGTDEFEDNVPDDYVFPERWKYVDDRYDARALIEENLELLEWADGQRRQVLQAGFKLGDICVTRADQNGLCFKVPICNGTDGHGVPTGFDADRLVWLYVSVADADGCVIFESGDLDPWGDVRDLHSHFVNEGDLPLDRYLLSLQGRFLNRARRGGEREKVLPVNVSQDPLPFVRRSTTPAILMGRPANVRKHKQGIAPCSARWGCYSVDKCCLTGREPYTITVQLKVGMVPINLVTEVIGVGIDLNMSPNQLREGIVCGHMVLWEKQETVSCGGGCASR